MSANREVAVRALLNARRSGDSLRGAAAAAGVHVATVCRWQRSDPELRRKLTEAAALGRVPRREKVPRPSVRWRKDCPECRARVVVRKGKGGVPFWSCARWPRCGWSSWRPRYPRDCPRCRGPRYWSHSRKSIGCADCGLRTRPL